MNYVSISAIIETYKLTRVRKKKSENKNAARKKTAPPALQLKKEM